MPTKHEETLYFDEANSIFAEAITKVITIWSLEELLEATDLPPDAKPSELRIETEYDGTKDFEISDLYFHKVEYFNKKGQEIRIVDVMQDQLFPVVVGQKVEVIDG